MKGLTFSPSCKQTSKPVKPHGSWQKTRDRLVGDLVVHSTANILKMFMFVLIPLEPKFYGSHTERPHHLTVHTVGGVSGEL